jgi:hypothetical protein
MASDPTALRDALGGCARRDPAAAIDGPEYARWENEGGRTSASASRDAEQRTTAVSERAAWRREPALLGDGDVAVALRDYTHDLRGARVGLASTLASVRALIAEHLALRVSPDVLAALQRDAVRSCLQTYFGP